MMFLSGAWGAIKSVPAWVWVAFASVAAIWMAYNAGISAGEAQERAKWEEAARKATERAREADSAATGAINETIETVEQGNEQARQAASGSDDPLRSALDSLRAR